METRKTPLALTASALAMALMLVGCGGGSSSSTPQPTVAAAPAPTPDPTPDPTPEPEPEPMTVDTSNVEGAKYLDEAPVAPADTTADIMIAAGEMANVGPYVLTNSHATESATVSVKGGVITATGGTVEATGFVEEYAKMIEAAMKMEMAVMTGRAAGMFNALTNSPARGQAILGSAKAMDVGVTHDGGAMVSVNGGESGWASSAAKTSISGWDGKMLSRKTESYTVYSNIEAPKRKAYSKAYSYDGTDTTVPKALQDAVTNNHLSVAGEPSSPNDPPKGQLGLNGDAMIAAAEAGLLDPTKFPQPKAAGAGNNEYEYTGATGKKATSFKGTFHGASGTYECTNSDCKVIVSAPSTTAGPMYTVTGGSWTFTPDTKNNPQIVEQDADHLHFGWWVNVPKATGVGGEYLYDAQVFAGGELPFSDTAMITALTGEATYEGPAAGLFAIKADEKNNIAAAHGEFMATAALTANFETDMVSGKIGTFVRDDSVANDWALTLGKTDISTGAGAGNILDGASVIGKWNSQLYGSGAKGANPTGIAGAFNAKITGEDKSVAAVAGAFGAMAK